MVRVRGGSVGTGRTIKLRDEEIVEPSTRKSPRGTETRGEKRKQPARQKHIDQTEKRSTVLPDVIDDEQPTVELSTSQSP